MMKQLRSRKTMRRILQLTLILVIPSFVVFYGWGSRSGSRGDGETSVFGSIKLPNNLRRTELTTQDWVQAKNQLVSGLAEQMSNQYMQMKPSQVEQALPRREIADQAVNVYALRSLAERYRCPVGYSGHERGILPSLLAGCLGAGGCAATKWAVGGGKEYRIYPGPKRPPSEVAVVECSSASGVFVTEIDGVRRGVNCSLASLGSMKIHLLPGAHTLKARLYHESTTYSGSYRSRRRTTSTVYSKEEALLEFEVEAGTTYGLSFATDTVHNRWKPTIWKHASSP